MSQTLSAAGQTQQATQVQQQAAVLVQQVQDGWKRTSDSYATVVAKVLVTRYVRASVLARRYAIEGFGLMRASWRLPVVASALGDAVMTGIVDLMPDPTAPEGAKGRPLVYAPGRLGLAP